MLNTGTPRLQRVVMVGKLYMVQRPDGRLLVGSTEENAGFDKRTTAGAIADLLQFACALLPLADAALERCWSGLRPGNPDGLPYLGPVPGLSNLFVAGDGAADEKIAYGAADNAAGGGVSGGALSRRNRITLHVFCR